MPIHSNSAGIFYLGSEGQFQRVVEYFKGVFPDELTGLQFDRTVEFTINLVPGAASIAKKMYRINKEELTTVNKQLK